ncbi:MAG: sel1 repeat family protein [Planctomycetaceae bacterium]|jgi:TPR repeat protein|nr:sel1 repeat family protein [Planctomycetaceae bacterium]
MSRENEPKPESEPETENSEQSGTMPDTVRMFMTALLALPLTSITKNLIGDTLPNIVIFIAWWAAISAAIYLTGIGKWKKGSQWIFLFFCALVSAGLYAIANVNERMPAPAFSEFKIDTENAIEPENIPPKTEHLAEKTSIAAAEQDDVKQDDAEQGDVKQDDVKQDVARNQYVVGYKYYSGAEFPRNDSEAVKWFRKAAEAENADGQFWLALCYAQGHGVEKDKNESLKWLRKAAAQGYDLAEKVLETIENGNASDEMFQQWEEEAARHAAVDAMFEQWDKEAAERGQQPFKNEDLSHLSDAERAEVLRQRGEKIAEAREYFYDYITGVSLLGGLGVDKKQDPEEAVKYLRKAADKGIADAQLLLGKCYVLGEGVPEDFEEAAKWYRKAAQQGYAEAQFKLAQLYQTGLGVEEDLTEAAKWYRQAAQQGDEKAKENLKKVEEQIKPLLELLHRAESGNPDAQYLLSLNYCFGLHDFKQNEEKYREWVEKASENSDKNSASVQCAMGDILVDGIGVEKDRAKAAQWYRKAAEQNFAPGQCFYAQCLADEGNESESIKLLRQSAEQEFAPAQYYIALICRKNDENTEAVKWYRKAAEQGFVKAQNNLGECYGGGIGVDMNMAEAMRWYRSASEQGYAEAQCNLGVIYQAIEQYDDAAQWYRKAAEQGHEGAKKQLQEIENKNKAELEKVKAFAEDGDAAAQYNLGVLYYQGEKVKKDYNEAAKWFRKAAEQGDSDGQYNMGVCYDNGFGVELDRKQAAEWYQKAAGQGNADAQYNLGCCYALGEGVERDIDEAVKWYRKAAEQDYPEALHNLADFYSYGIGMKKDEQEGMRLMRKSAELGEPRAQHVIGYCYENGVHGYEKNIEESQKWYRKSAKQGYKGAVESLQRIEEKTKKQENPSEPVDETH